jgi:prepilin-type N-terminal cleavage/methylation domain-containing protein
MISNNLQKGFSILELIISIMISTILMTAALTIFQQVSSGSRKIQNVTSKDLSLMILEKRLSDDLLGLSPVWFTKENITKKPEAQNESAKTAKSSDTKKQSLEQKEPNIEKNNFFYAQTQNNQLDFMTFISTNTLQSFATPRLYIARIVYLLQPDPNKSGFFMLQRKEEAQISNEINIEKIRQGTFYTIVKNIKNCSLEYGFIDLSPEKRAKSPDKEWKMKWVQQWGKEQENEKTENSDSEQYTPKLPDTVRIKITLQEFENGPTSEHQIYCIVPPSKEASIASITQKRKQQEITAQQTNLSNASAIMNNVQNSKATASTKNLFQTAKG